MRLNLRCNEINPFGELNTQTGPETGDLFLQQFYIRFNNTIDIWRLCKGGLKDIHVVLTGDPER